MLFSVILGITSGVQPFYVFLRALLFTAVFFGAGIGLYILINNFFPELLIRDEPPPAEDEQPGSQINITVGNAGEYAVPEMYKSPGGTQELGNIEDLISGVFRPRVGAANGAMMSSSAMGGIDRKSEDDYNRKGGVFKQDFESMELPSSANASPDRPAFTPMFGDDSAGLGGLPDLDSMSMAFSSGGETSSFRPSGGSAAESDSAPVQMQSFDDIGVGSAKSNSKSDKPQALQGDFSPQEIAQGIRTVLDKDK